MAFLPTLCLVLNRRPIERLVSGHLLQPLALLRALDHVSLAVDEFLLACVEFCFVFKDGATARQRRRISGKLKTLTQLPTVIARNLWKRGFLIKKKIRILHYLIRHRRRMSMSRRDNTDLDKVTL